MKNKLEETRRRSNQTTNYEEGTNQKDQTQTETMKKANPMNPDLPNANRSAQTKPRQRRQRFQEAAVAVTKLQAKVFI